MARHRKVAVAIWNDQKFVELSDDGQLLFLYLLTHPNQTSLGAMKTTMGGLADERRWLPERLSEAFLQVTKKGMAKYDSRAHCLWLPNFLKFNGPESPNVVKAWFGALDLIPECDLKVLAIQRAKDILEAYDESFREAFDKAFAKAFPKGLQITGTLPSPYPEPEPEPEQEKEPEQDLRHSRSRSERVSIPELHQQVIAAYRRILPNLPAVRGWTAKRRKALDARIAERLKDGKPANTPAYWEQFFERVAASDFLCGRRGDFQADLEWLIRPENFLKVIEGRYANRGTPNGGVHHHGG